MDLFSLMYLLYVKIKNLGVLKPTGGNQYSFLSKKKNRRDKDANVRPLQTGLNQSKTTFHFKPNYFKLLPSF